jgi:hypothetical protein
MRATRYIVIVLAAVMLSACGSSDPSVEPAGNKKSTKDDGGGTDDPGSGGAPEGFDGSFLVRHDEAEDATHEAWRESMIALGLYEAYAEAMNEQIYLPHDITIVGKECGEVNAFYVGTDKEIHMCYEYLEHIETLVENNGGSTEEEVDQIVADEAATTLMHEIGHAVIHVLDLPITGKEEDVADQIAAVSLINGDGASSIINSAFVFKLMAQSEDPESLYWDTHSLSEQRYANLLCWVYGSDPDTYAEWLNDGTLDAARAEYCPSEYEKMSTSISRIMADYLKQ